MDNSLLALYFSYKSATKYVVNWLFSAVGREQFDQVHARPSTTEIVNAAILIRDQNLPVPAYVLDKLQYALKKRREVHSLYVERATSDYQEENLKHMAFIDRLEQTYQILSPLAKSTQSLPVSTSKETETTSSYSGVNRYTCWTDLDPTDHNEPDPEVQNWGNTSATNTPATENPEQVLQDDELGEYIELSLFVYNLDAICAKVNGFWADAASGKLSIVVAGFLTNTAYHAAKRTIQSSSGLSDNATLIHKWYLTKRDFRIRFTDIPELQHDYQRFANNLGLMHYWQILHHCRTLDEYKNILPTASNQQDPTALIHKLVDSRESHQLDDLAFDKMQESMRHLLVSGRAISALEEESMKAEPLLPALDAALRDHKSPIPTHLVFGMDMLLSTYKSFLWPKEQTNKVNCRIASLKFANSIINSITNCMPCLEKLCWCQTPDHCTCPYKQYICEFRSKLKLYVQEKRFDLYYQAPWIASGHMIEILYSSMYEGVHLCCASNYVMAVLHLYNALLEVSPQMRRVTWLDQMCVIFTKSLFPGSIPKGNFSSVFRRSSGGHLIKTSSSHNGNQFLFSRGPSFFSERPTGCPQLSRFYTQHMINYQLSAGEWVQLYEERRVDNPTPSQIRAASQQLRSTVFSVTMEKIKDSVFPEFEGDMRVARIDYFSVFRVCIHILQDLCVHIEGCNAPGTAQRGFELVDTLLGDIGQHEKDAEISRLLPYLRPLNKAVLAFASLDKDRSLRGFAWDI